MAENSPRIALVHALRQSVEPIRSAFAEHWPQAAIFNVLDDSLSTAVELQGSLNQTVMQRLVDLARYAAAPGADGRAAQAMLVTSSAFLQAIAALKADLCIPVVGPCEAAFEVAIQQARRIGLLVTFKASESVLKEELHRLARARGIQVAVTSLHVPGALDSLRAGDTIAHDAAIAAAVQRLHDCELILFGQFSMARALQAVSADLSARVLTTPVCAVTEMRRTFAAGR